MLSWTIYTSFIGAGLLMLLPTSSASAARALALVSALAGLTLGLIAALTTGPGFHSVCNVPWIRSLGIHYQLGADGISLTLVLLTGVAAVTGILFSWNIEHRAKEFFALYLALIGGDTYRKKRFDLCPTCCKRFMQDPLGRRAAERFELSKP